MSTVTYLASGGKIGDIIKAEVTCDKCTLLYILLYFVSLGLPSWVERITDTDTDTVGRIVGKTLAYTSIRFMNEQHELVARGSHTK
jgi:acyl-coenzyme A thioesterase 13